MQYQDVITKEQVIFTDRVSGWDEAVEMMASCLAQTGRISSLQGFVEDVKEREREMPTYMGNFIGMPHAMSEYVRKASIVCLKTAAPFQYGKEGEDVQVVFMLAVPKDHGDLHIHLLSQLARSLVDDKVRSAFLKAKNVDEVYQIISQIYCR